MHEGAKEARATDTNKVWRDILTLCLEDPRNDTITKPKPIAKSSYGFNHPDTGRLLCPQIYLSDFDTGYGQMSRPFNRLTCFSVLVFFKSLLMERLKSLRRTGLRFCTARSCTSQTTSRVVF